MVINADIDRLADGGFVLFAGCCLHRLPLYSLAEMPHARPIPTVDQGSMGFSCRLTPFHDPFCAFHMDLNPLGQAIASGSCITFAVGLQKFILPLRLFLVRVAVDLTNYRQR